jgi:2-dehydropantoate 2-reductase
MGAIGTYIGGSLAAVGCELTFIEQAESLKKNQTPQLRIRKTTGDIEIPNIMVTSDLNDALSTTTYDAALLAIKAFDTPELVKSLTKYRGKFPPILCLQNGVENEPLIEETLGQGSVIGASITTAVRRIGLGDIQVEKLRGVGIENNSPLSEKLIEFFNLAGLKARGYSNGDNMKWSKMLTNLQVNATSAILDWTPAQVLSNPIAYRIEVMQLQEALAVMNALGVEIVDLPGTPVRLLVNALTKIPLSIGRSLIGIPLSRARGGKMPSLQIDLQAGREKSEVEFLNGAVCRYGLNNQIPTPVNQVLTTTLTNLASGVNNKLDYFDKPEQIWKNIEEYA